MIHPVAIIKHPTFAAVIMLSLAAIVFLTFRLVRSQQQDTPKSLSPPHVLYVVLDDLGSHDLGFRGSGILTPFIDQLVGNGLLLDNYYVLPYCSPTRASIMSGRYPQHTGLHTVIYNWDTIGLPLDEETLPQVLRRGGYQAHAVGKWHIGHAEWEQTPTFRGFQSFYGFYIGGEDYFAHENLGGYDLRFDKREFCGANCSLVVNERGNYSTEIFTREAKRIIGRHNSQKGPLFLYLAHQAVHYPEQVPARYKAIYTNKYGSSWSDRKATFAGMLTAADESIGQVIQALKDKGMWNNTLLVFTTDNGGPTELCLAMASSNYPLRGGKCTVWEGGTVGEGFISGPALKSLGIKLGRYSNLFHAVDWLPTLARIANITPAGKPLDGVSHLALWRKQTKIAPRVEIFVGYVYIGTWYGPALRSQDWKLIQGKSGGPASGTPKLNGTLSPAAGGVFNTSYLLYNITEDPGEAFDVAAKYPLIVEQLRSRLAFYHQSYVPPLLNTPSCSWPGLVNVSNIGLVWMPWCKGGKKIIFSGVKT